MKTHEFYHLLRAADSLTNKQYRFLLMGSQAILAHLSSDAYDDGVLFSSRELDIAVFEESQETEDRIAHLFSGAIGDGSMFDQTFGYYLDGVGQDTAVLPPGWKNRLVPVDGYPNMLALSFGDLAFSKLWAGRQKDIDFVKSMCAIQHPDLKSVSSYIESMPASERKALARNRWASLYPSMPTHRTSPR